MKLFTACKLTHTLQTYLGMVMFNGEPKIRSYPCIPDNLLDNKRNQVSIRGPTSLSDEALVSRFATCVLECRLLHFRRFYNGTDVKRLEANIYGCCDPRVDIAFMKRNIGSLLRLDLEQAAAVVISAIRNDDSIANRSEMVQALLKEIDPTVLRKSCMWLDYSDTNSAEDIQTCKFSHLVTQIRRILQDKHMVDMGEVDDWTSLLPFLLRIRRSTPRSRCLFIPEWIFREANTAPPSNFRVWDDQGRAQGGHEPVLSSTPDSIILTRREYRCVQRRLLRYFRFWDPEVRLRQRIKKLEADVIYGAQHIRSQVLPSNNTLVVAHYFFALQRRLQRKVVSDLHWTGFLQKGESGTIMQNNPEIPTSFEDRLGALSGQSGVPLSGPILPQIDHCCLLMESYVQVYGKGDRTSLVFVPGVSGGSGRGAVDEYNLLCDVLKTLCNKAKKEGADMPGRVRKFLAKDIMASNHAFDDDAFAGGRVPGWMPWLATRREEGVIDGIGAICLE